MTTCTPIATICHLTPAVDPDAPLAFGAPHGGAPTTCPADLRGTSGAGHEAVRRSTLTCTGTGEARPPGVAFTSPPAAMLPAFGFSFEDRCRAPRS